MVYTAWLYDDLFCGRKYLISTWLSVQICKDVQGPLFGNYTRITQIVLDFHLKTGYFILWNEQNVCKCTTDVKRRCTESHLKAFINTSPIPTFEEPPVSQWVKLNLAAILLAIWQQFRVQFFTLGDVKSLNAGTRIGPPEHSCLWGCMLQQTRGHIGRAPKTRGWVQILQLEQLLLIVLQLQHVFAHVHALHMYLTIGERAYVRG